MRHFILQHDATNQVYCQIWKLPDDLPRSHRPARGIPMGSEYPADLKFQMAPEARGNQIADVIPNALNFLMVSNRVRHLLSQHSKANIEFLRFILLNHKGRVASDELYIANVLGTREWADMERSMGARVTTLEGTREFEHLRRLYLKDGEVDPDVGVFRISAMPKLVLVHEELKRLLESEGVTGAVFHPVGTKVDIR
ncbi:hypothetical protein JY651_17690 [Pyxidicoccus parkwayensis]|uniref:Immunity MXAN-0049 protein domain-containing protein n=1 Tax=Pyxidicoccus parkwayensis TaxID=2813578 RepID=A0ABX7P810_9BACT|nr:DUF1629 domain-containing protein [Pyxidicoccus parkwaysis]QSQ26648.1 hypothetical protein JY651_17690 [Pyxidicoccus parkwaysis]